MSRTAGSPLFSASIAAFWLVVGTHMMVYEWILYIAFSSSGGAQT